MTAEEIIYAEFEFLAIELKEAYNQKGMKASGDWEDAIEVKVITKTNNISAAILGLEYSQQLETGRKPGKQPPSTAIEQWIKDKGIASNIEGKISISSLAYLIARKIGEQGWKREEYGGVELISEVVTPERIQKIINKVSDFYLEDFTTEIVSYLKQAA